MSDAAQSDPAGLGAEGLGVQQTPHAPDGAPKDAAKVLDCPKPAVRIGITHLQVMNTPPSPNLVTKVVYKMHTQMQVA